MVFAVIASNREQEKLFENKAEKCRAAILAMQEKLVETHSIANEIAEHGRAFGMCAVIIAFAGDIQIPENFMEKPRDIYLLGPVQLSLQAQREVSP